MTTPLEHERFCRRCKNVFKVTSHRGSDLCDMCWELVDHKGEALRPPPKPREEATHVVMAISLHEMTELIAVGTVLAHLAEAYGSKTLARRFLDILARNDLDVKMDPVAMSDLIASLNRGDHGDVEAVPA